MDRAPCRPLPSGPPPGADLALRLARAMALLLGGAFLASLLYTGSHLMVPTGYPPEPWLGLAQKPVPLTDGLVHLLVCYAGAMLAFHYARTGESSHFGFLSGVLVLQLLMGPGFCGLPLLGGASSSQWTEGPLGGFDLARLASAGAAGLMLLAHVASRSGPGAGAWRSGSLPARARFWLPRTGRELLAGLAVGFLLAMPAWGILEGFPAMKDGMAPGMGILSGLVGACGFWRVLGRRGTLGRAAAVLSTRPADPGLRDQARTHPGPADREAIRILAWGFLVLVLGQALFLALADPGVGYHDPRPVLLAASFRILVYLTCAQLLFCHAWEGGLLYPAATLALLVLDNLPRLGVEALGRLDLQAYLFHQPVVVALLFLVLGQIVPAVLVALLLVDPVRQGVRTAPRRTCPDPVPVAVEARVLRVAPTRTSPDPAPAQVEAPVLGGVPTGTSQDPVPAWALARSLQVFTRPAWLPLERRSLWQGLALGCLASVATWCLLATPFPAGALPAGVAFLLGLAAAMAGWRSL